MDSHASSTAHPSLRIAVPNDDESPSAPSGVSPPQASGEPPRTEYSSQRQDKGESTAASGAVPTAPNNSGSPSSANNKGNRVTFTQPESAKNAGGGGSSNFVSSFFFPKRDHATASSHAGPGAGAGGGGHPPSPNDRSPLAMLVRSFAYPVSDKQALEDSIRITLGHEPEGPATATFSGTYGNHLHDANFTSPQLQPQPSSVMAANTSLAVDPASSVSSAVQPSSSYPAGGSGVYERAIPTRNYSGLVHRQPGSTSNLLSPNASLSMPAGAPAPVTPPPQQPQEPNRLTNGCPLIGPVVPALDTTQANNGLPGGEHVVPLPDGEPYVFRYNIRVAEPPPPALLRADPNLFAAIQASVTNGSMEGYQPVQPPATVAAAAEGHSPYGRVGSDDGEENIFSPHEPAEASERDEEDTARHTKRGKDKSTVAGGSPSASLSHGSHSQTPNTPHAVDTTVATEELPHVRVMDSQGETTTTATSSSNHTRKRTSTEPLFSAVEREPHTGVATNTAESTAVAVSDTAQAWEAATGPPPLEIHTQTYLTTGSFHAQPILMDDVQRERIIVDCFNSLSSERRRLELLEAFYVAHMQPYEGRASFTGDNWDDVMTKKKVPQCFSIRFDHTRYCFFVTVFRHEHRVFLFSFLLRCFCIFLFWVIMFCMVPKDYFYPGGLYFDTLSTILFAGIVGTLGARLINIPTLIGVIWAGILWNNAPYTGRLTKGITLDIRQFVSSFGLTIGIIRAGLSLNVIRFKQKFKHYIAFSIIPMAAEMVVHGVCAKAIYKFPNYRWAFAEGFLLSSIAPSVVVPIIITYQRRGYGVRDGPPMMMLCSIAVDTAICVWGIQFLLALEFKTMSTALLIVLAPLQVIIGLVGGVLLGFLVFTVTFYVLFMEAERLPGVRSDRQMTLRHSVHVRYLSIGFMVLVGFAIFAVGKRFSCVGGSAICVVTVASTFNYLCVRGGTRDHLRVKADMAQTLTTVWDYIAMPSLFGLSGAAVNVHELFARDFIGQAFGLVFIGIGTRSLMAMVVPLITRLGLSWQEILFCGIGWIGKGSVQGSMGATAQNYAAEELAAATTPEEAARAQERINFGIKMKNTAVLGILVACPLCSIFLTHFTSKLLKKGT